MTEEQRRHEIGEIVKLFDQVAALSHHAIGESAELRLVLARLVNSLDKVSAVEDRVSAPAKGAAPSVDTGRCDG